MNRKRLAILTAIALTAIVGGCHWLGGGGWLAGLNGGKAHFGFEAYCVVEDDVAWFYEGDFQYMDKSAGVRFHGTIEWLIGFGSFETCEEAAAYWGLENYNYADLYGTCRTQPGKHEGTFYVTVEDNGTPGMAGDYITISTEGCGEDGGDYSHEGELGGGNIWFAEHDD